MHLPRIGRSFAWNWLIFSSVLTALALTWSLSTPLPSGPDEQTHFVTAAAVVRGELGGARVPEKPVLVRVRVPSGVAEMGRDRPCYYRPTTVGAACGRSAAVAPGGEQDSFTYVGGYPPLYYAATGWPSLFSASRVGLRTMRAVSAVLGGLLMGLAFATARRWSRSTLLPPALALGLTPAAIYLSSVLNPSGLEIASAAAAWTALSVLVLEHPVDPPRGLLVVAAVSASVLAATRPLSPLFVVAIVAALGIVRFRSARLLLRSRSVQVAAAAVAAVVLATGAFVLLRHSYRVEPFPVPPSTSGTEVVRLSVFHVGVVVRQLFGAYGSPNFGAPFLVLMVWGFGLAVLVGAALLLLGRRDAVLIGVGVVLVILLLPLAVDLVSARSDGTIWQARYEMPLALGIPVVTGILLSQRGIEPGRARVLAPGVVVVGLLVSWYWVLHRYQVGLSGSLDPFPAGSDVWHPPVPAALLFVLATVLSVLYGVAVAARTPAPVRAPAPALETSEPVAAGATTGSASG